MAQIEHMRPVGKGIEDPQRLLIERIRSILRREDPRFLTGRGRYTDNTAPREALAVLFVRSPHAHARLGGIERSALLEMLKRWS